MMRFRGTTAAFQSVVLLLGSVAPASAQFRAAAAAPRGTVLSTPAGTGGAQGWSSGAGLGLASTLPGLDRTPGLPSAAGAKVSAAPSAPAALPASLLPASESPAAAPAPAQQASLQAALFEHGPKAQGVQGGV